MNARQRIAVTGATGRLGTHIVDLLESSGHEVVPVSRSHGIDVITGEGLDEAFAGASAVIDAATGPSPDRQAATEFFLSSARNVQDAAARAGVGGIVVVSIIGCDRFSGGGAFGGYYAAKVAQEQAHRDGPVSAQILRAAQFHEFVGELLDWSTDGAVACLPVMRTQLVAARSVAEALAELATSSERAEPRAAIPEIAGPRVERLAEVARLLAARRGRPEEIEEAGHPEDPDDGLLAGEGLLPGPGATLAGPTYEEWLETQASVAAER